MRPEEELIILKEEYIIIIIREHYLCEASANTGSKLCGGGSTTISGIGSILIDGNFVWN